MQQILQNTAMKVVDMAAAMIPQQVPAQSALQNCKIISHRGEHDNVSIIENTLPAFNKASNSGVWGIECDLRWTADLVPVISHDECGRRLFDNPAMIAELAFSQLREQMPLIPSLSELVEHLGGRTHLMLEIKAESCPNLERQKERLQQQLSSLRPGIDYHFLALDPQLFNRVDFVPRQYCFPVAEFNVADLSRAAIDTQCGGLSGHYLLLNNRLKHRHSQAGQRIGTGFISSKNCLFRELNRGVEWVFSNDAVKIKKVRDQHLKP
jgi:glycerophosphoryl diester phosphodiesterase